AGARTGGGTGGANGAAPAGRASAGALAGAAGRVAGGRGAGRRPDVGWAPDARPARPTATSATAGPRRMAVRLVAMPGRYSERRRNSRQSRRRGLAGPARGAVRGSEI